MAQRPRKKPNTSGQKEKDEEEEEGGGGKEVGGREGGKKEDGGRERGRERTANPLQTYNTIHRTASRKANRSSSFPLLHAGGLPGNTGCFSSRGRGGTQGTQDSKLSSKSGLINSTQRMVQQAIWMVPGAGVVGGTLRTKQSNSNSFANAIVKDGRKTLPHTGRCLHQGPISHQGAGYTGRD